MGMAGWISLASALVALATLGVTVVVLVLTRRQEHRATERSVVEWRAVEDRPGAVRLTNQGLDTAFEVTAVAWDRHETVTESLPELEDGDSVLLELTHRGWFGPDEVDLNTAPNLPMPETPANPATTNWLDESMRSQREQGRIENAQTLGLDEIEARRQMQAEARQVRVRVTWRSELGSWDSIDVPVSP